MDTANKHPRCLEFTLKAKQLGFYNQQGFVLEPGRLDVWVGGDVNADLHVRTEVIL